MQITSCANETKWRELHRAMQRDWERAPYWRVKHLPEIHKGSWELRLDRPESPPSAWLGHREWDRDWYYHFRSDNIYREMEWVDVKPDENDTHTQMSEIISICQKIGFDYEICNGYLRIYGYRRS